MGKIIQAPQGNRLNCKNWQIEAPYRMIQNNLNPEVAEDPKNLIVYGGKEKQPVIGIVIMRLLNLLKN